MNKTLLFSVRDTAPDSHALAETFGLALGTAKARAVQSAKAMGRNFSIVNQRINKIELTAYPNGTVK